MLQEAEEKTKPESISIFVKDLVDFLITVMGLSLLFSSCAGVLAFWNSYFLMNPYHDVAQVHYIDPGPGNKVKV